MGATKRDDLALAIQGALRSKNRTTAIAQAFLAEEASELLHKAIELAKSGDVQMLKFLLDRILPKERLIQIDIPPLDCTPKAITGPRSCAARIGYSTRYP